MYTLTAPLLPLARALFPSLILTTAQVGQAMLFVARRGWPEPVLASGDILRAASQA